MKKLFFFINLKNTKNDFIFMSIDKISQNKTKIKNYLTMINHK